MGTLFNQAPRNYDRKESSKIILDEIDMIKDMSLKTGLTVSEVIETCKMLELRRKNNLYVMNGDAFDEQIAGIGELIKEFVETFRVAFAVSTINDSPSALEAIAMSLGYDNPCAIAGAIEQLSENIASGIDRYMDNQFDA
jgi:hypothetical protein